MPIRGPSSPPWICMALECHINLLDLYFVCTICTQITSSVCLRLNCILCEFGREFCLFVLLSTEQAAKWRGRLKDCITRLHRGHLWCAVKATQCAGQHDNADAPIHNSWIMISAPNSCWSQRQWRGYFIHWRGPCLGRASETSNKALAGAMHGTGIAHSLTSYWLIRCWGKP